MTKVDSDKAKQRRSKKLDQQRNRRPNNTGSNTYLKGHGKRGGRPGR